MHRYKILPPILLILSLINALLAAPVVLREARQGCVDLMADVPEDVIPVSQSEKRSDKLEKRWDEYCSNSDEASWQKRGSSSGSSPTPSVGEPPVNQESAPNSPSSHLQTGTSSTIQDTTSAPPLEINNPPPSGEDYPSSGESYLSDHGSASSENYHASDDGGPGPSKSYASSFSNTDSDIPWMGSNAGGTPDSSKSYPPWNRPELASNMGPWSTKSYPPSDEPRPNLASNEGGPGSSMNYPLSNRPKDIVSTRPAVEPFHWDPHGWSTTSSEAEAKPKKEFMSKTKSFLDKLVYKIKFWPRGPRGALNAAQRELQGTTR